MPFINGPIQIQIGGSQNSQGANESVGQSLAGLLVQQSETLQSRFFASQEVKEYFCSQIEEIVQSLNGDAENTLEISKYIVFPFKSIAVPENLQKEGYVRSFLDALAVLAFTGVTIETVHSHINIKIEGRQIFGVYYYEAGFDLRDFYVRLLRHMDDKRIVLPPGFVSIPLHTMGPQTLDREKIQNIVRNIAGDSDYIKPLDSGVPRCVSLTSYLIGEASSIQEARSYVRGALGLE